MIAAGVDLGSTTVKVAVVKDQEILATAIDQAGFGGHEKAKELFDRCLEGCGLARKDIAYCIATGYGRARVDFADKAMTEITCHARGAAKLLPGCRFVVDIGGQDSKAIALDEGARVVDFAMNDKCAAGTGRFLEVMASALGLDMEGFAEQAMAGMEEPVAISSICTVFAESEVIGQVNSGAPLDKIAAGICMSVASRVTGMAARLDVREPAAFTGGVSRNLGVRTALEKRLGIRLVAHELSQLAGAIGAALIAADSG